MKSATIIKLLISCLGILLISCSDEVGTPKSFNSVFDTLQGTWSWYSTYHPKGGVIENEHDATIKFLKVNSDSSISYETYKNGTLLKSGDFLLRKTEYGKKIQPSIIPNWTVTDEIYVEYLSKYCIKFYEHCMDCPFYFYRKIGSE